MSAGDRSKPSRIAITGASRGLGAGLALSYAGPGVVLDLLARGAAGLDRVAAACRAKGASVNATIADVADAQAMAVWTGALVERAPPDLMIANAGLSGGSHGNGVAEGLALVSAQIRINLLGAAQAIEPMLPAFSARGHGHIAVVASIAALRGLPYAPGYCASKAGLRAYGEALRALLAPSGVAVSVILPGFFMSDMSDRFNGPQPFRMPLDAAVARIRAGLDRRRSRIVFPARLALAARLADLLPASVGDHLLRRYAFRVEPG